VLDEAYFNRGEWSFSRWILVIIDKYFFGVEHSGGTKLAF
jgi:hypothetical protein